MKDRGLKMAKIVLLALPVIMFWMILRGSAGEVDFSLLREDVEQAVGLTGMKQGDARLLRRFYGLNGEELENWTLWTAEDNMAVEELLLAECESEEQAEQVRQAAEARVETQKKNFEGYGPEQVQLLDDSVIRTKGTCVLFVVSAQARQAEDAFEKAFAFRRF